MLRVHFGKELQILFEIANFDLFIIKIFIVGSQNKLKEEKFDNICLKNQNQSTMTSNLKAFWTVNSLEFESFLAF